MKKTYSFFLLLLLFFATRIAPVNAQACNAGTISASQDTLCAGTTITLIDSGSVGSIIWQSADSIMDFSNITGATASSYISIPLAYTTYFRVIVSSSNCSDTSLLFKVTIAPRPASSFSWSAKEDTVTFNSDSSTGATAYYWSFGDSSIVSNIPNPVHYFPGSGIYNVCLTVKNNFNCTSIYCTRVMIVDSSIRCNVSAAFTYSVNGLTASFYSANPTLATTLVWTFGDNSFEHNLNDAIHTYYLPGTYQVCLQASDFNCGSTQCEDITVSYPAGIEQVAPASNAIQITPNPCTNCLLLGIENEKDILITDVLGRNTNATLSKTSGGFYISMPGNTTGIYFAKDIKTGKVAMFLKE